MKFDPEFKCYALGPQGDPLGFDLPDGVLTFQERFDFALIDGDADFELKRLAAFVTRDNAAQTDSTRNIPTGILFNIRDTATGRLLFSNFADSGELFGDGCCQFVLPTSHFFRRNGTAQVVYAPSSSQGPDFENSTVWFIMVGAKHFSKRVGS